MSVLFVVLTRRQKRRICRSEAVPQGWGSPGAAWSLLQPLPSAALGQSQDRQSQAHGPTQDSVFCGAHQRETRLLPARSKAGVWAGVKGGGGMQAEAAHARELRRKPSHDTDNYSAHYFYMEIGVVLKAACLPSWSEPSSIVASQWIWGLGSANLLMRRLPARGRKG